MFKAEELATKHLRIHDVHTRPGEVHQPAHSTPKPPTKDHWFQSAPTLRPSAAVPQGSQKDLVRERRTGHLQEEVGVGGGSNQAAQRAIGTWSDARCTTRGGGGARRPIKT